MRRHISITIERALAELEKGKNLFEPLTPLEAFHALMDAKAKGWRFITGCDKVDGEGRCLGHYLPDVKDIPGQPKI